MTENEGFSYTYSAREQMEIQKIRERYLPRETDRMEQIRRLDRSASKKGILIAVSTGVIGALLLGLGMCCTMVWAGIWFVPGILLGILGIVMICPAYPLYHCITRRERAKIASEILRLTDELMHNT